MCAPATPLRSDAVQYAPVDPYTHRLITLLLLYACSNILTIPPPIPEGAEDAGPDLRLRQAGRPLLALSICHSRSAALSCDANEDSLQVRS